MVAWLRIGNFSDDKCVSLSRNLNFSNEVSIGEILMGMSFWMKIMFYTFVFVSLFVFCDEIFFFFLYISFAPQEMA